MPTMHQWALMHYTWLNFSYLARTQSSRAVAALNKITSRIDNSNIGIIGRNKKSRRSRRKKRSNSKAQDWALDKGGFTIFFQWRSESSGRFVIVCRLYQDKGEECRGRRTSLADFDIYTKTISRYLEEEYFGRYKSKRIGVSISRRLLGRVKERVLQRI